MGFWVNKNSYNNEWEIHKDNCDKIPKNKKGWEWYGSNQRQDIEKDGKRAGKTTHEASCCMP